MTFKGIAFGLLWLFHCTLCFLVCFFVCSLILEVLK